MTNQSDSLSERITFHYEQLSQSGRRIADYLQGHPDKIVMQSTAQIAKACGVSKTTVSRFIRQLGYDDHLALREEVIQQREQGVPVLTSEIEDPSIRHEMQALEQLWAQLATLNIDELIKPIATARRVVVIGYRNSYPVALHLRQQLMQCRDNVHLLPLPGQTVGEDLSQLNDDDFVIVIGIRRRVTHFAQLMEYLRAHHTLLITDQSGQRYSQQCQHILICQMNNHAPLDSYAVPMSLIAFLVNQVYLQLGSDAVTKSRHISQSYSRLHEVE
ncbi:MurR/RpiR family transcriptional regulator [Vibrio zhugei]|uniref:MurR/RpiR family transcriptional regulator n=1 Tax=Vibrio zhugei TaxID=2479546 RepID=A0ABV7CEH5_9VIBR|nr:MurR/RpiR family transcriptional regulator [Vibrio zhugei]